MGGMSIWHWVIVLLVVVLLFGTKKLANMGSDVGKAVKGFKDGVKGDDEPAATVVTPTPVVTDKSTIDVAAKEKSKF